VYESKLRSTKYFAGDFFSLADLNHFLFTYYVMKSLGLHWLMTVPMLRHGAWEDISSRPAFKKVAEGMSFG
jgi:glutathione S-transferase